MRTGGRGKGRAQRRPGGGEGVPATRLIGGYLLLTVPLLVPGAFPGGGAGAVPANVGLILLHLGLGALLAGGWPPGPPGGRPHPPRVIDLLPFVAFPLLYIEVPLLNQVLVQGFQDPVVVEWEARWFGDPASTLAGRWPWPLLSEGLHLAYLSYYALVALPPLALFLGCRNGGPLRALGTGVTLAYLPGLLVFPFIPTEGPRYGGPPPEVSSGPVRDLVLTILEAGSSRGTAFPSLHMSVAVAASLVLLVARPRLGVVCALLTGGMAVGAVYGGFHYAVDMVAGGVAGVAGGVVGGWLAWRSGGCTPPRRR